MPGAKNEIPVIDMGGKRVLPVPGEFATIAPMVTDDGFGTTPLLYSWKSIGGPTAVLFSTNDTLSVEAHFELPGSYRIELTINDDGLAASAQLEIEVLDLRNHLIAHWPLDDGTNMAMDLSGNGLHLALHGAGWEPGVIGKALNLAGNNDWGDVADTNKSFAFAGDFSVSFWIKTTQRAVVPDIPTVFRYATDAPQGYRGWEVAFGVNGLLEFKTIEKGNIIGVGRAGLNDGKWHHFVGQRKGTDLQAWIDGEYLKRDTSAIVFMPVADFFIGGANGGNSVDFDGSLDDIRIFSRSLSPNEIAALANAMIVTGWAC